ncbi:hypothetical protein EV121DRAFT_208539 [Schizophyllum commune]
MGKSRAKAIPSADGVRRGTRATGQGRRRATVTTAPLRRSARLQARLPTPLRRSSRLQTKLSSTTSASSSGASARPQRSRRPANPPYYVRFEVRVSRQSTPDGASSSGSSSASSPPPTFANMDGDYRPPSGYQDDSSTTYTLSRESSPTGNIDNLTSRPGHQRLIEKSPLGRICVITWLDNSTGAVQDCHILDRCCAGDPGIVRGFETIMVLDPYSFSVDCTANRVFLDSSTHIAFDNGHIVFFPTERDLNRMLSALKKEVLAPIEGQQESPTRNAEGFTHHKDVFPDDIRPFHVAILSSCGRCVMRMKTLDSSSSEHDTFEPPFDEPFPIVQLHCSPYFVVWKAYKTLRNSEVHAPAHLSKEEQLIRDIGEIMWDYGLAPKA